MDSNLNEHRDKEFDVLESNCNPLSYALKLLDSLFDDKSRTFADKVETLVSVWQKIVEFIVVQPMFNLNEEVFENAYPQTIFVLLHSSWLTVDETMKEHLRHLFEQCLTYFERFNSISVINIKSLIKLVDTPWEDPVLKQIINNYHEVSHEDLVEFFKSENLLLISTRIKVLIKSKSEDLALQLVNSVVMFTGILPSLWIDVYVRVMTRIINTIEHCRALNDIDRLRYSEKHLSRIILLLSNVMKDHFGICRELILTAFSLNPTRNCFSLIKRYHRKSRTDPYLQIDLKAIPPETGKVMTRSSNYSPFKVSSQVLEECEEVGMNKEVAGDLISIITNQRYKKLSWMHDWKKLKIDCRVYMKKGVAMRNDNKELKYLNLKYNSY